MLYYSLIILTSQVFSILRGRQGHDRDHMVALQLPLESVPVTAKVVSLNPAQARVLDTTLYDKV